MEVLEKLKKWKGSGFMKRIITWRSREQRDRQIKIQLIDHILTALCTCELNEKGRQYLTKLKDDIINP